MPLYVDAVETTVGPTIIGGTIDDAVIGGNTPTVGNFTNLDIADDVNAISHNDAVVCHNDEIVFN